MNIFVAKKMTDREKLRGIRKAIQQVIDYPTKKQGRRSKDGYPTEFAYDEFVYKRMIDSVRNGLKAIITPYETARNRLIPHAKRHADKTCGKKPWTDKVEWAIKWNRIYLAEMDRLAKFTRLNEGG